MAAQSKNRLGYAKNHYEKSKFNKDLDAPNYLLRVKNF